MKIPFLAANILPTTMTLILGSVLVLSGCQNNNNVTVEAGAERPEQQESPSTSEPLDGNSIDNSDDNNSADQNEKSDGPLSADPSAASAVPAPLKGIWFENTDEGRGQCAAYQSSQADEDLLGAVVFDEQSYRSYAEYGEGNYSKVTSVENTGQNVWLIESNTEIEGDTQASISKDTFVIDNELLSWTYEYTEENNPVEYTQQLFRCKLS